MFTCSFCDYTNSLNEAVVNHTIKKHKSHPSFSVSCTMCGASYRKYDSYRKHVLRKHNDTVILQSAQNGSDNEMPDDGVTEMQITPENREEQLIDKSASYIMQLRSVYGLSQSAVNFIVSQTRQIVTMSVDHSQQMLLQQLPDNQLAIEVSDVIGSIHRADPFSGLDTEWMQKKHFQEKFGMLQPCEIVMGHRTVTNKSGQSTKVAARGYIVPFLQNLKQLIDLPEVQAAIVASRQSTPSSMTDFVDGSYCRQHRLFSKQSIQISGYYDDIEVVNPIGVHTRKHKLSLFFWTLLNIPPQYRSKLSCIQIIAIAKTRDCKDFGLDLLLHDFVSAMQVLHNDGISVSTESGEIILYGGLLAFFGDTPAANLIAGFKEGVGFAQKVCRTCEASRNEIAVMVTEDECMLRDGKEHERRCSLLQTAMTDKARRYWSSVYGVNKASVLSEVPNFSVTECFLHDPMHILFEGVTAMEMKLLLKYCLLEEKYFTIAQLNSKLFELSAQLPSENRPNAITVDQIKSDDYKLRQTAHQMWWLSNMLPLLIGFFVPKSNPKWLNFIRILQIQQLCTSPVASSSTVCSLTVAVARHNSCFTTLYPDSSVTPKMHYLLHLPNQIRRFGPARNHWCMRYEGKNSFFKRNKLRNTKNIPLSVINSHQMWMCCAQHDDAGCKSHHYLKQPYICKPGHYEAVDRCQYRSLLVDFANSYGVDKVLFTSEASCNGVMYKAGDVLMTKFENVKEFQQICVIAGFGDKIVCVTAALITEYFCCHQNCYFARLSNDHLVIEPDKLSIPWPTLSVTQCDGLMAILPFSLPDLDEIV